MKKITVMLAFIVSAFSLYAQNNKTESEIRNLEEKEHKAMLNRDIPTLKTIWATDFMVNTPVNRVSLSSQELFDLIKAGVFNYTSFTRNIEQVLIKGNTVFTMGSEAVVPVGDTPKAGQTINRRYTNIWMKQGGVWRLTARHANEIVAL